MSTGAAVSALDTQPLLALLERRFAAHGERGVQGCGAPRALWERALLGPLREFLSRPGKELRARLVALGFTLGGGDARAMPVELPLLLEILHAGSLIVDDIEDGSHERRGRPTLHRLHGVPLALNAGNWLYFWPQVLLAEMPLPEAARLAAHERIARCLLRCHEGQALDLAARVTELAARDVPEVARTLSTLKTGELVGLATGLGAVAASAQPGAIEALSRFGRDLGVGLQMLDDLSGVRNPARRDKALEDLRLMRVTWVWAWLAEELEPADYAALIDRLRGLGSSDGAEYDDVLAQVRFRIGMTGLRRPRQQFASAIARLERVLGSGEWERPLRAELEWLERQFLGGTA
jgi:geranylgeranyl pyrophosphate synthase